MLIMCMVIISLCDELVTSWCFRVCMYMMQFRNVMLLFLCCDFFLRPHCNFSFEIIKFTLPYLTLPIQPVLLDTVSQRISSRHNLKTANVKQ